MIKESAKEQLNVKYFWNFQKTKAKLPDSQCPGIKRPKTEWWFIKLYLIHVDVNNDSHEYGKRNGEKSKNDDELDYDELDHDEFDYDGDIIKDEKKFDDEGNYLIISQNGIENHKEKLVPLLNVATYSWKNLWFTQCTTSCFGGEKKLIKKFDWLTILLIADTQDSNIECIRDDDNAIISIYLCDINNKPDSITRKCNDIPWPPSY